MVLASRSKRARVCSLQVLGQHLDGHVSIEARVSTFVDLTHPTGTERAGDLVWTETGPGLQGHRGTIL